MHFSFPKFPSKVFNKGPGSLILPVNNQIRAWRRANRKMSWGISKEEFDYIEMPPTLTDKDQYDEVIGVAIFYGFGDDGSGSSDSVLSGKLAWEYASKRWWSETWQCEYIDFDKEDQIRLRPGAPPRPKGFYYAKLLPGEKYGSFTVSQVRRMLDRDTGWGPEGIQFLSITHTHFQGMMSNRKIPFMALADYDVAPYGFNDFFDSIQMFCSNNILGLGIGNVDFNYPLFVTPLLRLEGKERF